MSNENKKKSAAYKPTLKKASIKEVHQTDKTKFFVDNVEFYEELIKYQETKVISNRIAEILLIIAQRFATQHYYRRYPFKEDMIMSAVENNLKYIGKFDTEKYNNPFSYFTQCTYFAFRQYIIKEKKQLYTKYKSTQAALADLDDVNSEVRALFADDVGIMNEFISTYEAQMAITQSKRKNVNTLQDGQTDIEIEIDHEEVIDTPQEEKIVYKIDPLQEIQEVEVPEMEKLLMESIGIGKKNTKMDYFDRDMDIHEFYDEH